MEDRLTIGAFARQTGLTAKALRNYDAMGLLVPASTDPVSGYRLYDRAQIERGREIRRLRALELSLEDIRAILDDPAQGAERIAVYRREVEADLYRRQRILHHLRRIDEWKEHGPMTDDVKDRQTRAPGGLTPEEERQVAVDLFNHTWELLETAERTREQEDRMVHAAHASRFHWERVGTPTNLAVGEWQVSRVYAVLGRGEPAVHHATRCREICEEEGVEPFYLAEAYEALARAHAVAGDRASAADAEAQAWRAAERITDDEERQMFEQDMASLPR
ncbi:MAG TPA: MerR family transcriptional regulator [Actinomycetota bacterium]